MRSVLVVAALVAAGCPVVVAAPAQAHATPGHGVNGTPLWQKTDDGTDYTFREVTIAPAGSTGWHWHTGPLYAVVKQGTLTHNMSDCSIDGVYSAGDGVYEPSGADHVHIGRNLGDTPVVLHVLYILPSGSPLAQDAPDPGCGFS
jgi:quercetin dioxygenase-like cupin family protein